ncbi:MAG: excinuclease ABC subunit UvrA [Clostridiales bacterium]|nr:excinuclease ABC subunit UvrA [Clostridiales bacterium]
MENFIVVKGAKENNLKNVDVKFPRNKMVVFTGVSGSGKSTLAFKTIFAEGQRRYIESLSSYARMFLGQAQKPDVESIEGLSPAISIDQKTTNHNPRSTVGTVTEIYDYFRLLFSRVGEPICPNCNQKINKMSVDQIVDQILELPEGTKIYLEAPVVRGKKGTYEKLIEGFKKSGYARINVDGVIYSLDENFELDKNKKHNISVVVDRLSIKPDIHTRLTESIEVALKLADGLIVVTKAENLEQKLYSTNYACPYCGWVVSEITPRMFSFNNPFGACPNCTGLGYTEDIDEDLVLKNSHLSIKQGAFNITGWSGTAGTMASMYFNMLSKNYGIDLNTPVKDLPKEQLNILLYGNSGEKLQMEMKSNRFNGQINSSFEGIINNLSRRYKESTSEFIKFEISKFIKEQKCRVCNGKRLNETALCIKIDNKDITQMCDMSVDALREYMPSLKLNSTNTQIAEGILKEINARLQFLYDVGLGYLTLNRSAESLSGGESQRIRLATQIGSGLMGVVYILDEPSIGLHQRDNDKLLSTLFKLRDLGNTLIVVEHDEDTIKSADFIVDIGPKAGVHGGEVVACGSVEDIKKCKNSITGKFLSGEEKIEMPAERRQPKGWFKVVGAKQNNLKNMTVKIPTGVFVAITGVSGSGKSSLVNGVMYPYLANNLNRAKLTLGKFEKFEGIEQFDKVINIDQDPIGKTPRSNPATYTGVWTAIRELFASTQDAKTRGYGAGRFSFNIAGGRCEVCDGAGVKNIEMYFLPDITIPCEACKGTRYNRETLEVKYKGKSIADVLDMTVEEALKFFENIPNIVSKIQALYDVGLGYIKLGQSATELSGGEAQRVKLATELSRKSTGKTIYILDEPTTGLHSYDVKKLIGILQRLVSSGNSVVVIEHNLDVIKSVDYIIDLGPEGGNKGGEIIAKGTPEEVAKTEGSYTGKYLNKILN